MNGDAGLHRALLGAARLLRSQDVPGYLVGGCLRDRLLGREIRDIDVAVAADALIMARSLADALGATLVPLDADPAAARIVLPGGVYLDLATLQKGDIRGDLLRRDFTVDALALELNAAALEWLLGRGDAEATGVASLLIDVTGGLNDLRAEVLRVVREEAFAQDPLRLLRAVRLRAELGFALDPATQMLIRRDAALIAESSAERIRDEVTRLLVLPGGMENLALLDDLGLLEYTFPEVVALQGVAQPPEHAWDVFWHSLHTLDELERVAGLLGSGTPEAGDLAPADDITRHVAAYLAEVLPGGRSRLVMAKLAALLHDVAKPACRTVEADGRIRFFGHAGVGAELAAAILERLRFSTREVSFVRCLVANHMRPAQLADTELTGRAIYRFFRDTATAGVATLLLSLADHRATRGPNLIGQDWLHHLTVTRRIMEAYYEAPPIQVKPARLVSGDDLMQALSIPPGPAVGRLLELIREAQASGEVRTREEALTLAASHLE